MIIFGASGDLTLRKLAPAMYNLDCAGLLPPDLNIIGFGRRDFDHETFKARLSSGVEKFSRNSPLDEKEWDRFSRRLHYFSGRYDDPAALNALNEILRHMERDVDRAERVFYFALPFEALAPLLETMRETKLLTDPKATCRAMVEKPFGRDLQSAEELNATLELLFGEHNIYRIDHYIAKDTIRNLLVFRFANTLFEPVWNSRYIESVQITAAEDIGVANRGGYYEKSGVVRDMLQNHVLQILALVAMEPPEAAGTEAVRDKKVALFEAVKTPTMHDAVFGQYEGYRLEKGVAPDSRTPTFAAARLFIENTRWNGTPFYVRSGKALAKKESRISLLFRKTPRCVLERAFPSGCGPNSITIRLQPEEGIRIAFSVKKPGITDELLPADLEFRYTEIGLPITEAYERVLLDGFSGRPALFWRADGVEQAWRIVEPFLPYPSQTELHPYTRGTWGPKASDDLLAENGHYWM